MDDSVCYYLLPYYNAGWMERERSIWMAGWMGIYNAIETQFFCSGARALYPLLLDFCMATHIYS